MEDLARAEVETWGKARKGFLGRYNGNDEAEKKLWDCVKSLRTFAF